MRDHVCEVGQTHHTITICGLLYSDILGETGLSFIKRLVNKKYLHWIIAPYFNQKQSDVSTLFLI